MPPKEQTPGTSPPPAGTDMPTQANPQPPQVGDIIVPQTAPTPSEASDPIVTDASSTSIETQELPVDVVASTPIQEATTPQPAPEPMSTTQEDTAAPAQNESQAEPEQNTQIDTPVQPEQPALTSTEPAQPPSNELPVSPVGQKPKRHLNLKALFMVLLLLFVYIGSAAAAYYLGTKNGTKTVETASLTAKANSIQLPKEAIVTAECTPGRGKQYIIPKDIPVGPIYDVKDGNVIAIEYLISLSSLLTQADSFTDKITELTKTYTVDHFKLVPTPTNAGQTDQLVHLIMFIVPKSESESITCDGAQT